MRKRRPTKNGQTVAKLKQLPPTGYPLSVATATWRFFCWGEKDREIYALASGELAEEKEEGKEKVKRRQNYRGICACGKSQEISQFAFIRFFPEALFTFAVADCVTRDSLRPENRRESIDNLPLALLNPIPVN